MKRIKTFKETGRLCAVNNLKGKYTDPRKYGQRYCQFLYNGHDFCPYGCPVAVETVKRCCKICTARLTEEEPSLGCWNCGAGVTE